jgi:ketosteroid isomerase-like protein
MKRLLLLGVLAVAASGSAMAQESGKESAPGPKEGAGAEASVMRAWAEYREALTKRDTAKLERIWADDYTFVNGRGMLLTKAERLQNIKSGATQFDSIEDKDRKVRLYGDTALITGKVTLKARYSGQEASGDYRYLNVWVKRGGKWQLVANQITPITKSKD